MKHRGEKNTLPALDDWIAALRGGRPAPWQTAWWTQWQDNGFPRHWSPPTPWTESEMCELLVLWLAYEVARGGRRQLVWATGRRGGERPFFLAARAMSKRLATTQDGVIGNVSHLLRCAAREAGGSDPLDVVSMDGCVTPGQRWLPPGQPGVIVMDLYDLVSGMLFRAPGAMSGQSELIAAGLSSAAAWVVVNSIIPRAAWETLSQLQEVLATEPGATASVQLSVVSRCAGPASEIGPVATLCGPPLQPRAVMPKQFISEATKLIASLLKTEPVKTRQCPQVLMVVNEAATAVALGAALKRAGAGPVQVVTGQEPRRVADSLWRQLAGSPDDAAVWILSGVADVTGLPVTAHMLTEVAPWDVLAHRAGQWAGTSPIIVLGGHLSDGPAVNVWHRLHKLAGSNDFLQWQDIREKIRGELSALQEATSAAAAGWSPEGFCFGPRLTSGLLDLSAQTFPVAYPPCPLAQAVWGSGADADTVEVGVIWRPELDTEPPDRWREIIRLLPPASGESCRVTAAALAKSLCSDRWYWSQERVGGGKTSPTHLLQYGRGVICRVTGEMEVFGLPSATGEILPVEVLAGDTVVLPASNWPTVFGHRPSTHTTVEALWEAGCPVFSLGPHIPGLKSFPWRKWWALMRRPQAHQQRLIRWLQALASHLETIGEQENASRLRNILDSESPAVLWPQADECHGWLLFPWFTVHHAGHGTPLPPGVTWRLGEPLGPWPVTAMGAATTLLETVHEQNEKQNDTVKKAMQLAAQSMFLGIGYAPLRQAISAFHHYMSAKNGGGQTGKSDIETLNPQQMVIHARGTDHPLTNGWVLSRQPGEINRHMDIMDGGLAVWDHFPWEFLSVGALSDIAQSGMPHDMSVSDEIVELAMYLVATLRGRGRPLPAIPGSGQIAALAATSGAVVPSVTFPSVKKQIQILPVAGLGDGVAERFWRVQRQFGRWGAAKYEADWRWLVWRCLQRIAGAVIPTSIPSEPKPSKEKSLKQTNLKQKIETKNK